MPDIQRTGRRVLIADDDPVFLSLASACLETAGFMVTVAYDGAHALEILRDEVMELAIVDLDMPRIDGLRLIGLVRGLSSYSQPAILVISASQHAATYNEARRLGADAFLTKPVDWSMLPVTIRQILNRRDPWQTLEKIAPEDRVTH